MRIKNVDPKGWYDIPDYDGLYQINYWGNVRKRLKYGCYKQLHPYVKNMNIQDMKRIDAPDYEQETAKENR